MTHFFVSFILAAGWAAQTTGGANPPACGFMDRMNSPELTAFLWDQRQSPGDCTAYGLVRLSRHAPAMELAIQYLGYKTPRPRRLWGRSHHYPAISLLYSIGKPVLPRMIEIIAQGANDTVAENAVHVVMLVFGDNRKAGVEYLNEANRHAKDDKAAERLLKAARFAAANLCVPEDKPACEAVLFNQSRAPE